MEFIVTSGNYSLDSLEALSANSTAGGSQYVYCHEGSTVSSVVFQPSSDMADLIGSTCIVSCANIGLLATYPLTSNFTINGYWDYPLIQKEANDMATPTDDEQAIGFAYPEVGPIAAHIFVPGVYTLAVEDAWGQFEVLHFVVSPPTTVEACYQGGLPANDTAYPTETGYTSTQVFNVTGEFGSWNWGTLPTLQAGPYYMVNASSGSQPGAEQHRTIPNAQPQVSFSVWLGQAEVSSLQVTQYGGWPPDLSPISPTYEQSFFLGAVGIQLLFPCGAQDTFLVVTARW